MMTCRSDDATRYTLSEDIHWVNTFLDLIIILIQHFFKNKYYLEIFLVNIIFQKRYDYLNRSFQSIYLKPCTPNFLSLPVYPFNNYIPHSVRLHGVHNCLGARIHARIPDVLVLNPGYLFFKPIFRQSIKRKIQRVGKMSMVLVRWWHSFYLL